MNLGRLVYEFSARFGAGDGHSPWTSDGEFRQLLGLGRPISCLRRQP